MKGMNMRNSESIKSEQYNSLIDGEYVNCHKRKDNSNKNLFASFDIYYLNGR